MAGRTRGDDPKDQIVVATDHLDLVGRELGSGAIVSTVPNSRLGLTLVTLADPAAAGRMLEQRRIAEFPDAPAPEVGEDPDRVLAELRLLSERRYCGWVPTLGKNRTLDGVEFKPYTHGFDKPTPARRPEPVTGRAEVHGEKVRVGLFDTRIAAHEQLEGSYLADAGRAWSPRPRTGRPRLWWEGHATFIAGIIRRHAPSAVLDVRTALLREPDGGRRSGWTMPPVDLRRAPRRVPGRGRRGAQPVGRGGHRRRPAPARPASARSRSSRRAWSSSPRPATTAWAVSPTRQRTKAGLPARGAALFPAALDDVLAVGALDGGVPAGWTRRSPRAGRTRRRRRRGSTCSRRESRPSAPTSATPAGRRSSCATPTGTRSCVDFDGWASWSGTSFAAGEITGEVAALLAQGLTAPEAVAEVRRRNPRPEAGLGA